jgi:hypothetical protein
MARNRFGLGKAGEACGPLEGGRLEDAVPIKPNADDT